MISMSDAGIGSEIIGFILLLLVGNRNPNAKYRVLGSHKPHQFDVFREKIIPDKYVSFFLSFSIVLVVIGLIFQISYFNSPTIINKVLVEEIIFSLSETMIALIGVIVSAVGISLAIVYNARSIRQNTRSHYYSVLSELDTKFAEIETHVRQKEPDDYLLRNLNFHTHLHDLVKTKILPSDVVINIYKNTLPYALWIANNTTSKNVDLKEFSKWCKKNNVLERKPSFEPYTLIPKKNIEENKDA